VAGGEGECGDDAAGWLVRERRSLDILPVKKEAKLSASEVPGELVGSDEEDLRCRSLLAVCHDRQTDRQTQAHCSSVMSYRQAGSYVQLRTAQRRC